jgi:ABC-type Fe3+ transport system substrate-binding protein
VEAAKREGKVTVTVFSAENRADVEAFSKFFPEIKVEAQVLAGRDFSVRVPEERRAGIFSYDVYYSGGTSALTQLIPLGGILGDTRSLLVLPEVVDDKNWIGGSMDDHWMDDNTKRILFGAQASAGEGAIRVNTNKLSPSKLAKLEDLFNPELKGKWCADDPRVPGSGASFFADLTVTKGPEFVKRLLRDTGIVISRDRRKMAEDLIRGDVWACVGAALEQFQLQGLTKHLVEITLERGPIAPEFQGKIKINCCGAGKNKSAIDGGFFGAGSGGPAIVNNAPHPNAAKALLNWLLTKEGMVAWFEPLWSACGSRVDIVDKCQPGDALQDGKAYVTFHRASNVKFREAGQNLAREVLGR